MIKYGFTAPDMTVTEFVEDYLPSAQPEQPEWVQEVERLYNKYLCKDYIDNPFAWALFEVWKKYDRGEYDV